MARIAIVTDSTADLSSDLTTRLGISIVPLTVQFGDEAFRDQVDLTTEAFMERLTTSKVHPTTSQPTPAAFEAVYRALAVDHDAIISIHISQKLSGTVASANLAGQAVRDLTPVHVIDSQSASMGLGLMVLRARDLASRTPDPDKIAKMITAERAHYDLVFAVDTLEYLRRGGRIGRASALLGTVLDIKPLLRLVDGEVTPFERTRTRRRAISTMVEFVRSQGDIDRLAVLYSSAEADADRIQAEFDLLVPAERRMVARLGPVLGTHVGPGALGIAVVTSANRKEG